MDNPFFNQLSSCSTLSTSVNEQLYGTAPKTNLWVMVEYTNPFGSKALIESLIPERLQSHLTNLQKIVPGTRLVLIRRDQPRTDNQIAVFASISSADQQYLYEFHLSNYDEILSLDLQSLITGKIDIRENIRVDPIFLVCTNGKRDPCCSRLGYPVYQAMASQQGDSVWQTSHVGGHRFAANVICLPHGIYYGRVNPENAVSLMSDYQNQRLTPYLYRGRGCYDSQVQAAEYFFMESTSIESIDALQLIGSEEVGENRWEIKFLSRADKTRYKFIVAAEKSTFEIFESCSKPDKSSSRLQYHLVEWSKA